MTHWKSTIAEQKRMARAIILDAKKASDLDRAIDVLNFAKKLMKEEESE